MTRRVLVFFLVIILASSALFVGDANSHAQELIVGATRATTVYVGLYVDSGLNVYSSTFSHGYTTASWVEQSTGKGLTTRVRYIGFNPNNLTFAVFTYTLLTDIGDVIYTDVSGNVYYAQPESRTVNVSGQNRTAFVYVPQVTNPNTTTYSISKVEVHKAAVPTPSPTPTPAPTADLTYPNNALISDFSISGSAEYFTDDGSFNTDVMMSDDIQDIIHLFIRALPWFIPMFLIIITLGVMKKLLKG